jgi:hypothetical protein
MVHLVENSVPPGGNSKSRGKKGFPNQINAKKNRRPPRHPFACPQVTLRFRNTSRGRHQERKSKIGGRIGQDARCIFDRDSARRRIRNYDIIEPNRMSADDLNCGPAASNTWESILSASRSGS